MRLRDQRSLDIILHHVHVAFIRLPDNMDVYMYLLYIFMHMLNNLADYNYTKMQWALHAFNITVTQQPVGKPPKIKPNTSTVRSPATKSPSTKQGKHWSSTCHIITGYGSTLYIGIAMVFVYSPYILKYSSYFQFQVSLTFNEFTEQYMSKISCVPNLSLKYQFWAKL